jgi:hypothetical protein
MIDQPLCCCLHLPLVLRSHQNSGKICKQEHSESYEASSFWCDRKESPDNIEAHIGNAFLLEINTSLIRASCSYLVSASLHSLHKTNCVQRSFACSTYTVLCAMLRTAQQQAVAWFTLSRGVLVHATLTSIPIEKCGTCHSVC